MSTRKTNVRITRENDGNRKLWLSSVHDIRVWRSGYNYFRVFLEIVRKANYGGTYFI